jgi:hypothetical protein
MAKTFKVADDSIVRGTVPTDSTHSHTIITQLTGVKPEAFGDNGTNQLVLANPRINGFISTVCLAFDNHLDLVLTPDDIWLAIVQGFALHVNANAEELRGLFVGHDGKKEIRVRRDDFIKGSSRNDWTGVFKEFSDGVAACIGSDKQALLVADFSTTGIIERAASEIALLDVTQAYFDYTLVTRCGIPHITLTGTKEDWQQLKEKARALAFANCSEWVASLVLVLQHFVDAFEDQVDLPFWNGFFKLNNGSGGPYVNGWINVFFPHLLSNPDLGAVRNSKHTRPNPYAVYPTVVKSHGGGGNIGQYPKGFSRVPFIWEHLVSIIPMEFLSGFLGARPIGTQAVQPVIGWGISQPKSSDQQAP